ncbi:hypothetical protein CEXT_327871, partial [Caerostris extrusa]
MPSHIRAPTVGTGTPLYQVPNLSS